MGLEQQPRLRALNAGDSSTFTDPGTFTPMAIGFTAQLRAELRAELVPLQNELLSQIREALQEVAVPLRDELKSILRARLPDPDPSAPDCNRVPDPDPHPSACLAVPVVSSGLATAVQKDSADNDLLQNPTLHNAQQSTVSKEEKSKLVHSADQVLSRIPKENGISQESRPPPAPQSPTYGLPSPARLPPPPSENPPRAWPVSDLPTSSLPDDDLSSSSLRSIAENIRDTFEVAMSQLELSELLDHVQKSKSKYHAASTAEMESDEEGWRRLVCLQDELPKEKILQEAESIDSLIEDAEVVQSCLRNKFCPGGQEWEPFKQEGNKHSKVQISREAYLQGTYGAMACVDPGVKGRVRLNEKSKYKDNNFQRLCDVSRFALVYDKPSDLLSGLEKLKDKFEIVSLENRFRKPTSLGWSDVTILVCMPLPPTSTGSVASFAKRLQGKSTCHYTEIQCQLDSFVETRRDAHKHYVEIRQHVAKHVGPEDARRFERHLLYLLEGGHGGRMRQNMLLPDHVKHSHFVKKKSQHLKMKANFVDHTWVLHPEGTFHCIWDLVGFLILIIIALLEPLLAAFQELKLDSRIEMGILCYFSLDILVNFNTALSCSNEGKPDFIVDRKQIAKSYLRRWFWIDLAATVPFDKILSSLPFNPRVIRICRFLRMIRLLKCAGLRDRAKLVAGHLDEFMKVFFVELGMDYRSAGMPTHTIIVILKFILFVMVQAHYLVCIVFALSKGARDDEVKDMLPTQKYKLNLVWATSELVYGSFDGSCTAPSTCESFELAIVFIALHLFNLGILVMVFANITANHMENLGVDCRHEVLKFFMHKHEVSKELRHKVNNFYNNMKMRMPDQIINTSLNDLSHSLKRDLMYSLYRDALEEFEVFQQGPFADTFEHFAKELSIHIKCRLDPPEEVILRQQEKPDCMFYISEGTVRSFVAKSLSFESRAESSCQANALQVQQYHGPGSYLGIEALFVHDGPKLRSMYSAITEIWTTSILIPRKEFDKVVQGVHRWHEFVDSVRQCVEDDKIGVEELREGISTRLLFQLEKQHSAAHSNLFKSSQLVPIDS